MQHSHRKGVAVDPDQTIYIVFYMSSVSFRSFACCMHEHECSIISTHSVQALILVVVIQIGKMMTVEHAKIAHRVVAFLHSKDDGLGGYFAEEPIKPAKFVWLLGTN